jgi:hypothetical protein
MTKAEKQADEIAALKARVEELERAAKPPEPFKREPWQPIDYTAGMSMPPINADGNGRRCSLSR